MATIASPIDFTGEVNIPNSDDAYTGVAATVQSLIDEYEPQLLTELLGETLYAEMIAGLPTGTVETETGENTVVGTGTHFDTMFEVGDTITIDNETQTIATITDATHITTVGNWSQFYGNNPNYYGELKWITLRDKVKPMILKYVYYYYLDANIVLTTGIGSQAPTTEAGQRASAWGKQVKEWNKMVKKAHELVNFLTNNSDYPDYKIPYYYTYDWVWGGEYWLGCYGYRVQEIYTFKNSLGV